MKNQDFKIDKLFLFGSLLTFCKTNRQVILIWIFAYLFIAVFTANAQTPVSGRLDLTVSPPVIELNAKPGQKIQERFRVRNNLNETIDLEISARRLISDPVDGNPVPESEAKGEELKWVSFDKNTFTAQPREWVDINFTIDIPQNAAFGYYYVFRITPKGEAAISSTGTDIKGEILVVALLTVNKTGAVSKAELVDFKAKNNILEYLPAEFLVKLANKGNVHVKPRGNIFISRGQGEEIAILEVNEGSGSILPAGTREFSSFWEDGFIVKRPIIENGNPKLDDKGNTQTTLEINWNKLTSFRIGPYTARLLMVYDTGEKDETIEGATTFWVIPYTAIAVILISAVILFFILRFLLRWYVKRAIARSKNR